MKFTSSVLFCSTLLIGSSLQAENLAPKQNAKSKAEVQLGSSWTLDDSAAPLVKLSRALRENATGRQFRVTWNFVIAQSGANTTALYDRERRVLKIYSNHYNEDGFNIKYYLFSTVNDESIHKLAEQYKDNDEAINGYDELSFFTHLTKFGSEKRDLGSRFVSR